MTLPSFTSSKPPLTIPKSKIIGVNSVVVHLCIPHQLNSHFYSIRITDGLSVECTRAGVDRRHWAASHLQVHVLQLSGGEPFHVEYVVCEDSRRRATAGHARGMKGVPEFVPNIPHCSGKVTLELKVIPLIIVVVADLKN